MSNKAHQRSITGWVNHLSSAGQRRRKEMRRARATLETLESRMLLSGQIFVANSGNGTIGQYTTAGATTNAALAGGLVSSIAITVFGSNLYVLNSTGTIGEYTTSGGTVNAALVSGLTGVNGIAATASDIFVSTATGIGEYSTSGGTVNASLTSGAANGVAVSGSDLFVTTATGIKEYTTSGTLVNGSLVTGLSTPEGIVVSGSDIFVANFGSGTIGEYTTSGTTVNASLVTGLSDPESLTISGSDLFVQSDTTIIAEYTTSGATVNEGLVTSLTAAQGVVASGSDLFVPSIAATNDHGVISEFTTSGTTVNLNLVSGIDSPGGIAISGSNIFVANFGTSIIEFTTAGATVNSNLIPSIVDPQDIAVSGSDLFITTDSGIGEYTTSGATVNATLVTGLDSPTAIAISGSDIFVLNSSTGVIGEYTTSGTTVNASLATLAPPHFPVGLAISGSDLFVLNNGTGTVSEFTTSGTSVNASLVTGLDNPEGIAVSGSELFITNSDGTIGEFDATTGSTVTAPLVTDSNSPGGIAVVAGASNIPVITWANPADITYGTALSGTQLDATAKFGGVTVPGTFVYAEPTGTVLSAGNSQTLSVTFNPTDTSSFSSVNDEVEINVAKKALTVSGISAANKPFDGNTAATLNTGSAALVGVIAGDTSNVSLVTSGATGTFATDTVGNSKTVTITGLTLTGSASANYTVTQPTAFANINANVAPIGSVGAATATSVTGWAIDQDTLSTAVMVRVDIDGVTGTPFAANIARPDLVPIYGTENHGFVFTLPTLSVGLHRVDVFALDTTTSTPTLLASKEVDTNIAPTGAFAAFDGSLLKGWAFDANAGSSSIQIRYQIDSNAPQLATASVARSDLTAVVGSADHGFAITLPQLAAGSHTVSVWAVDSTSDNLVLLGTQTATVANPTGNPLPIGSLAMPSTTLVKGWAYDPTSPTASISVRIDIDGVAGTPFVANVSRPDLTPVIGSANHGFSQSLSLTAGEHRITVYALDSTTSTPVLIGSQMVDNPSPTGSLGAITATTVKGWAFSGGLAGASATIRLDIDGSFGTLTTANVSRPDLIPVVGGSGDFGFLITLPKLLAGGHTIKVWVIDPNTLTLDLIGSNIFITT